MLAKEVDNLLAFTGGQFRRHSKTLKVEVTLERVKEKILCDGTCEVEVAFDCSRCLEDGFKFISARTQLILLEKKEVEPDLPEEEEELTEEEINTFFISKIIDLNELLGDLFLSELPPWPICDSDCKGLCDQCGTNLNQGSCGCRSHKKPSPFDVLKNIKLDK